MAEDNIYYDESLIPGEAIRQTLIGLRKSQKLKLDAIAHELNLSRSELCRRIVDAYLNQWDKDHKKEGE